METKADPSRLAYAARGRDSNAWFTPAKYVNAARAVLDGIDLDPFSSEEANRVVKAKRFYSEKDDAFRKPWKARALWMNPPYAGAACKAAVLRFLEEWRSDSFQEAVFLVNNATETQWFQKALKAADAVCLTDHRIAFWNADGKAVSGNTRGQAFFYFGPNAQHFARAFAAFGAVILGRSVC
jgi:phage N-6-adenine-methyltransferase